jgi:hypothetical protein
MLDKYAPIVEPVVKPKRTYNKKINLENTNKINIANKKFTN